MNFKYSTFSIVLFVLLIQNSYQQINPKPITDIRNVTSAILETDSDSSSNGGILSTIRNTTDRLISRLNEPRDRIIRFISPIVKSNLSRNVTNVLNSIWSRVQGTNVAQSPIIRNSIVRPINASLERLKEITAPEEEHNEVEEKPNVEVINLNKPDEKETSGYEMASASSNTVNPIVVSETGKNEIDNQLIKSKEVDNKIENTENLKSTSNKSIENQMTKSLKKKRSPDYDQDPFVSFDTNPDRFRRFYNRINGKNHLKECLGLAVCDSNCRLNQPQNRRSQNSFNPLKDYIDGAHLFNSDNHDSNYYLRAKQLGQRLYYGAYDCHFCRREYYCPHDRKKIMDPSFFD